MTGGSDERDQQATSGIEGVDGTVLRPGAGASGSPSDLAAGGPATAAVDQPGPVTISESQVTGLRATSATISDSRIESLTSQRTDLNHSFAQRIETKLAQLNQSTAVRIETDRLVAEDSRAVGIIAQQARFVRSRVGFVISPQVELGSNSRILVHLGPLKSTASPAVSTRTAAAFGAGLGAALTIGLGVLRRRR